MFFIKYCSFSYINDRLLHKFRVLEQEYLVSPPWSRTTKTVKKVSKGWLKVYFSPLLSQNFFCVRSTFFTRWTVKILQWFCGRFTANGYPIETLGQGCLIQWHTSFTVVSLNPDAIEHFVLDVQELYFTARSAIEDSTSTTERLTGLWTKLEAAVMNFRKNPMASYNHETLCWGHFGPIS